MREAARRPVQSLEQAPTGLRPVMQALRDLADELASLAKKSNLPEGPALMMMA